MKKKPTKIEKLAQSLPQLEAPKPVESRRESVNRLIQLLEHYSQWTRTEFRLCHDSGLHLWTNIGPISIFNPRRIEFTMGERWRLRKHVRRCLRYCRKGGALRNPMASVIPAP